VALESPDDPDSPLAFSMEGYSGQPPPALIPFFWAPGWNSIQSLNKFQAEVGGELRGGAPGKRLIEPRGRQKAEYFSAVPGPFQARDGRWLMIPIHHIFGSEELSARSGGIAELSPTPYVALNPRDVEKLNLEGGAEVEITVCGVRRKLPFKPWTSLPVGIAGVPAGLAGLPGLTLPAWAKLAAAARSPS